MKRSSLQFPEGVREYFGFLTTRGFRYLRSEATIVRYESARMAISIYHGRHSYEIALEVGPLGKEAPVYSFSEVMRLVNADRAEG